MDGCEEESCRLRLPHLNIEMWGTQYRGGTLRCGPPAGPTQQISFSPYTNQSAQLAYDAAGNVVNDGFHQYTYDAEGNVLAVDGGSTAVYSYDAMNERVQVTAQGFTTQYAFGLNGQRVSSWDGIACAPTLLSANTYWNGTPVSVFDGYQNSYQHQDLLGTKRLLTGSDGSVIGASTSLPFGDGLSLAGADSDPYHFAGLDHDAESGTEHASFRQYSSTFGRWMSPDPYSGSYDFTNPQSLNRYTYVLNNPLTLVDPAGLDPYCANGNPTDDTQALCNGNNNAIWMDDSTTCLIGTPGVQCTNPAAYAPIEQTVTVTAEPSSSLSGGLMGLTGQIPGIDSIGGGGVAPSNAPSQPCFVQRAQNILPNSQYLGPGDFVDGHQQYYFSAPASDFGTNGLNSFSFLGIVPNGYRTGSVFQSIHANGPHGIPNPTYFEIHEDLMNPASGLFGAVGHGLLDYGLGKLNQLGIHINLDGKC